MTVIYIFVVVGGREVPTDDKSSGSVAAELSLGAPAFPPRRNTDKIVIQNCMSVTNRPVVNVSQWLSLDNFFPRAGEKRLRRPAAVLDEFRVDGGGCEQNIHTYFILSNEDNK